MHENHRERMRERYLQGGFDSFATHEILEMALYYAIPRGDTNEIAHQLMERFGSLKRMFEASVDELQEVPGVGIKSAILLKMIPELARRYAMEKDEYGEIFDTVSRIGQYFCRKFLGSDHELLYMMLLDNRMRMLDCRLISEGSVNSSVASIRRMTELAFQKKASAVVLAHNHPHGVAIPSRNDVEVTDNFNTSLNLMGITLVEHLVVADDRFCTIMKNQLGTLRCSPVSGRIDSGFYDKFYDVDAENWTAPPIFEE